MTRPIHRIHARIAMSASAIAFSALLVCGCAKKAEQESSPEASVSGQRITFPAAPRGIRIDSVEKSAPLSLSLPGRLAWDEDRTVRVFSPFAGRVMRWLVQPGDAVKAGQVLAEVASPDFGQAQSDAHKAAADATLARQNLTRATELHSAGIVAEKDLQSAQADFKRADSENARAQMRLKQVGAGDGQNFLLKAPIAGIVVDKAINPGQELRPDQSGAPLFVITDPSRLWIWIDVAESDLPQLANLAPGIGFSVSGKAYPDRVFSGKLIKMADYIDPAARTLKLLGSVDNAKRELKGEMFVTAEFRTAEAAQTVAKQTVPASAVILEGDKRYVFVQEDDKSFSRKPVQVVREQADRIAVTGLEGVAKVVTDGNLFLQQLIVASGQAERQESSTNGKAAAVSPNHD